MTPTPLDQYPRMTTTRARLVAATQLGDGMALARWDNERDDIRDMRSDHHTLSVYLNGAGNCSRRLGDTTIASHPNTRLCLMPATVTSNWQVHGPITLLHLYFTDAHLRRQVEQVWDKDGRHINLDELDFADDPLLVPLFQTTLSQCDWQDPLDRLTVDSAVQTALLHTLRNYTQRDLPRLRPRGGLAPWQLKRVVDCIEHHLDQPLTLADLARQVDLSDYHFARMFKQSTGQAPHRYVMQRRLSRAREWLTNSSLSMTEIALRCGFSSASHFSNRFRAEMGRSPSTYRRARDIQP
ncbi:helix-turn-helix domain-containing protein [Saccharospirillum salsuginis]|uniref:AraC family transcriptional regulator n=1 Tax=Saccharospirillum salsuginis TaxID=418750 RepID=A0A918NAL2_9GAMM|nr:helix-turn-helix domain-containing protein [Saccharospirillum salsuginis]GGX53889.1 AraC family transcriptional regulator [Saccharospirillum salsuginis]